MGIFTGIENVAAEGTSLRRYFEPGNYIVRIEKVLSHQKRIGGELLFIVETTIKKSSNPNIRPGEQRNWVQPLSKDRALERIKTFIGVAHGLCPDTQIQEINKKITEPLSLSAISEENPLRGKEASVECVTKLNKKGKPYTQATWGVICGQ